MNPPKDQHRQIMVGLNYPQLDGIRGIAILLVLVFHCRSIAAAQTPLAALYVKLANFGWVGVDLFFVLSGFLITGILLDTHNRPDYFVNFYTRRVLRIFPPYYASIAIWTVTAWWLEPLPTATNDTIVNVSYWFYLQNWLPLLGQAPPYVLIHFWSLAVEEQFYIVWPTVIRFAAIKDRVAAFCIFTAILGLVLRAALILIDLTESAFYFTLSRTDALAIGAYIAVLFRNHETLMPFKRSALILFITSGVIVSLVAYQQRGFYNLNPVVLLVGLFPLNLLFGSFLVISLTSPDTGIIRLFLQNQWLRTLGRISYGVYILHWPIMLFMTDQWPTYITGFWLNQGLFFLSVALSSIALAHLSFRFFESPILNLKNKLAPLPT